MAASKDKELQAAVDAVLETLPPVWDRIRSNLRGAATSKFGISLDQFHTLRHIKRGFRSVSELSEKRQVSKAAISQSVDSLARKGLVTRRQEEPDRRCVLLELTPYAREVMDANYEDNRAWVAERMSSLTVAQLAELGRAMTTLRGLFAPEEGEARP